MPISSFYLYFLTDSHSQCTPVQRRCQLYYVPARIVLLFYPRPIPSRTGLDRLVFAPATPRLVRYTPLRFILSEERLKRQKGYALFIPVLSPSSFFLLIMFSSSRAPFVYRRNFPSNYYNKKVYPAFSKANLCLQQNNPSFLESCKRKTFRILFLVFLVKKY